MRLMQGPDNPVAVLPSEGNYVKGSKVLPHLQKVELCKGLRVMLRHNISVKHGLVNGIIGTIRHIVYHNACPPQLPTAVLVHFPTYRGPTINGLVPVERTAFSACDNDRITIVNIPLLPAYAMTFHKCQGQTIDKVHLKLGNMERFLGATYVGLSRVKRLLDLTMSTVPVSRFLSMSSHKNYASREAFIAKLRRLS